MIQTLKEKMTSRKFLVTIVGIVTGFLLIASGNTNEGVGTIIASVVSYISVEGYIDAKAVISSTQKVIGGIELASGDKLEEE